MPLPCTSSLPFFTHKATICVEEILSLWLNNLTTIRMEQLQLIKELLWKNEIDKAIQEADNLLLNDFPEKDQVYYLRANAWRKMSNWKQALDDYQRAADLNPQSPAVEARRALIDILEFYNKDMYNQ